MQNDTRQIRAGLHNAESGAAELFIFSTVYVVLSVVMLFQARKVLASAWREERARRGTQSVASRR